MTRRKKKIVSSTTMARALAIVRKYAPSVRHVEDATEDLDIEVTKRDLGKRKDHNGCVLAEACKRQEKATTAIISRSAAYIVKGDTATRYLVTPTISREIVSFDRGAGFETGDYTLKRPCDSRRLGNYTPGRDMGNGPGKKRRKPHVTENVRESLAE